MIPQNIKIGIACLLVTICLSTVIFLYFRNRMTNIEHKINTVFQLIQDHNRDTANNDYIAPVQPSTVKPIVAEKSDDLVVISDDEEVEEIRNVYRETSVNSVGLNMGVEGMHQMNDESDSDESDESGDSDESDSDESESESESESDDSENDESENDESENDNDSTDQTQQPEDETIEKNFTEPSSFAPRGMSEINISSQLKTDESDEKAQDLGEQAIVDSTTESPFSLTTNSVKIVAIDFDTMDKDNVGGKVDVLELSNEKSGEEDEQEITVSKVNDTLSQSVIDSQVEENNDGDNGANHSGEKESVDATDELLQAATQVANEIKTLSENKDYKNLTVNELKKLAEEKGLKKYKRLSKKKLVELLSSSP